MTSLSGNITSPVLTDPDTQQAVRFLGGLVRMRARAADTAGAYALLEHTGERGYMSPLHLHESDEETFLILDGTLRVEVGNEVRSVGAGGLALLPRGLAHGFVVTSPTARFLTLHTPGGGFDAFVADVGVPFDGTVPPEAGPGPDPEELTRLAAAHGIQIVGPPLLP
ncbi:cupin domain-containing protein [Streptomyces sp. Ru62]|uniref:cupin domain-containing protein n=1 Tax=Streptomyces sp. Ru62 TaxID=2080745 RepID=UPI000CDD279B|nr:cupin domain-containing protein [Streptomyces sp. Ru62]POX58398.1 cupin domain-containing protein [Streptomyces sp. Ru62]